MKIETIYSCELCGTGYTSAEKCKQHEDLCKLAQMATEQLCDPPFFYDAHTCPVNPWSPPPINQLDKWSQGDRVELAQRLLIIFDRWGAWKQRVEVPSSSQG